MAMTATGSSASRFTLIEWILYAGVGVAWGSVYLLIAIGLESLPPLVVTSSRIALGVMVLALVPSARRVPVARCDWPRVALLGLLWMAIPLTLFPLAQRTVDSAIAGMLNGAQPLLAALVAALWLRRRPSATTISGLLVGFTGVAVVVSASLLHPQGSTVTGIVLILIAVGCYALSANLAVPLQQRYGALPVVLRALAVAMALTAPLGVADWLWTGAPAATTRSLLAVLVLGVVGTGFAYVMFTTLLGRVGATRGSTALYLIPVVALALGVGVAGEQVPPGAALGATLVLAGAWLSSRSTR